MINLLYSCLLVFFFGNFGTSLAAEEASSINEIRKANTILIVKLYMVQSIGERSAENPDCGLHVRRANEAPQAEQPPKPFVSRAPDYAAAYIMRLQKIIRGTIDYMDSFQVLQVAADEQVLPLEKDHCYMILANIEGKPKLGGKRLLVLTHPAKDSIFEVPCEPSAQSR